MRIGVKFCGGCNAQYDRSGLLEKIKASFPDVEFEYVREDEIYDRVLFLQGCERACALRKYKSKEGFIDVKPSSLTEIFENLI